MNWYRPEAVTGQLPGKGTFGKQFQTSLPPLASKDELQSIASDPQGQQEFQAKIETKIDALRAEVAKNSGAGGARRILTVKEEGSVVWLLDHAEAQLHSASVLWDTLAAKWENRKDGAFPLHYGDMPRDFHAACENKLDQTVTIQGDGRAIKIRCPSVVVLLQRPKDRAKVLDRFAWALESVRCAEWGLNRILLYKRALAEYHEIDFPKTGEPAPPPPSPADLAMGSFTTASRYEEDLCQLLGIGCEVGPGTLPPNEGGVIACPDDFCVDPDDLPDPDDLGPEGSDGSDVPTRPRPAPKTYSTATVVTAGVVGAAAVYGLVQLLRPRL